MKGKNVLGESPLEREMAHQLTVTRSPRHVREHRFHPTRKWRFDFAWPEQKVAMECEGGVFTNGGHTRGRGYLEDCEKYSEAAALGWRIIRATGDQIKSGQALGWVRRALGVE